MPPHESLCGQNKVSTNWWLFSRVSWQQGMLHLLRTWYLLASAFWKFHETSRKRGRERESETHSCAGFGLEVPRRPRVDVAAGTYFSHLLIGPGPQGSLSELASDSDAAFSEPFCQSSLHSSGARLPAGGLRDVFWHPLYHR